MRPEPTVYIFLPDVPLERFVRPARLAHAREVLERYTNTGGAKRHRGEAVDWTLEAMLAFSDEEARSR